MPWVCFVLRSLMCSLNLGLCKYSNTIVVMVLFIFIFLYGMIVAWCINWCVWQIVKCTFIALKVATSMAKWNSHPGHQSPFFSEASHDVTLAVRWLSTVVFWGLPRQKVWNKWKMNDFVLKKIWWVFKYTIVCLDHRGIMVNIVSGSFSALSPPGSPQLPSTLSPVGSPQLSSPLIPRTSNPIALPSPRTPWPGNFKVGLGGLGNS